MALKICKWLFLLLVVSLPLVRPFNLTISGLRVPFTDFIFVAAFAFWLLALIRGETRLRFDKFYYFIAFYGLALTISTVFSVQPQKSLFKLAGVFYLFGLAVLTFNLVLNEGFLKHVVIAWLVGTVFTILASAAGFALFYLGYKTQADNYFLSHFGSLPAGNYPRIHALFANANMMCNFLNVSLMLAVLAGKVGWCRRIYALILQGGIWLAAIFTFSAGLGGMVLTFGIWLWALFRANKKRVLAQLVLVSAIFFALLVFASTLISPDTKNTALDFSMLFSEKKFEPSVRVLVWQNAFENFTKNPLIGKGTGTDAAFLKYETLSGDNQILLDAHNSWLNVAVQTGLFGLVAFSVLTAFLFVRCRFRFSEIKEQNLVHLALSCAFAGAFLYQSLSGSFEDARHLWILFGLLGALGGSLANTGAPAISSESPQH